MIWKKSIYDTLTGCAVVCNEFATECSNQEDIDSWYRSILLALDCADMCRNLAILYVRGSENANVLAKASIEVCEKCAKEVSQFDNECAQRVFSVCQQTILSCAVIVEMNNQMSVDNGGLVKTADSLFYTNTASSPLHN